MSEKLIFVCLLTLQIYNYVRRSNDDTKASKDKTGNKSKTKETKFKASPNSVNVAKAVQKQKPKETTKTKKAETKKKTKKSPRRKSVHVPGEPFVPGNEESPGQRFQDTEDEERQYNESPEHTDNKANKEDIQKQEKQEGKDIGNKDNEQTGNEADDEDDDDSGEGRKKHEGKDNFKPEEKKEEETKTEEEENVDKEARESESQGNSEGTETKNEEGNTKRDVEEVQTREDKEGESETNDTKIQEEDKTSDDGDKRKDSEENKVACDDDKQNEENQKDNEIVQDQNEHADGYSLFQPQKDQKQEDRQSVPADAAEDSRNVYRALRRKDKDKLAELLIDLLSTRDREQRQQLRDEYWKEHKKDMVEDVKKEARGDFEQLVSALLHEPAERDAHLLHAAMKGLGTDESALIHILATRSPKELLEVQRKYKELFGSSLEADIIRDTSGSFNVLCLVQINRTLAADTSTDPEQAKTDAAKILKPGSRTSRATDDVLIEVLTSHNPKQMDLISEEYKKINGVDITETIVKTTRGHFQTFLLAIVSFLRDGAKYHADILNKALGGFIRNDRTLINVMSSYFEENKKTVKKKYLETYGRSLDRDIRHSCGGDYAKLLLALSE